MPEALIRWCQEILPRVAGISEHARRIYSEEGHLHYFTAVAASLNDLYHDPVLARAGFLHGINSDLLEDELGDLVEGELASILRERERLLAVEISSPVSRQQLETLVLPRLRDNRSARLLVIAELHNADPALKFTKWVSRFHCAPGPVPTGVPSGPHFAASRYHTISAEYVTFLSTVVATTARYFGLWHEKDVVEDFALIRANRDRFDNIVQFAQYASDHGPSAKMVEIVRKCLDTSAEIHWEWRHVASMNRWLPRTTWNVGEARRWITTLHQCGFVTAVFPDEVACYRALRSLHDAFPHREASLRDTLSHPTRSGYRALHTEIVPAGIIDLGAGAVAVRLLPQRALKGRFEFSRGKREATNEPVIPTDSREIHVFAPDGRSVILPVGATVLNFAHKIHSSLPVYVRGAQINRNSVWLLHPLDAGDVVWLDVTDEPKPLPPGWEDRVPAETVPQIARSQRLALREAVIAGGRQWLRDYLSVQGTGAALEDDELDQLVLEVDAAFERRGQFKYTKGKEWWYRELGLYEAELKGQITTHRMNSSSSLRNNFLDSITKTLILNRVVERYRNNGETVIGRICAICRPAATDSCVVARQDRILFLHQVGAPCARGELIPLDRQFAKPQYVVVLGTDRRGLAAEVLDVFAKFGVGIEHLAGARLNQGSGIIRVRLDATPPRRMDEILRALRQVSGATVYGPDDPSPSQERLLSKRQKGPPGLPPLEEPYDTGEPIESETRFYGMASTLSSLEAVIHRVSSPASPSGAHVFLHGPKRTGKTSTVFQFMRKLERSQDPAVLSVYAIASSGKGWSEFSKKLARKLLKAARDRASSKGVDLDLDSLSRMPLVEMTAEIRDVLGCSLVLAIDEALFLMQASKTPRDRRGLGQFAAQIRELQGVLTIWIGPTNIRKVPETFYAVLQSAKNIQSRMLTPKEVGALLRTENYGMLYGIHVDEGVANRISELTGGNPFWVGWLASHMWTRAPRRPDGIVEFTDSILKQATLVVVRDPTPFIDRYKQERTESRTKKMLFGAALWAFAEAARDETRPSSESALSEEALEAKVGEMLGISAQRMVLLDILQDLVQRGSIVATEDATGQEGWRIAAPLLARHVLLESRGDAKWLLQ